VLAGAGPVRVGDLADHLAALLDGVEDGADVEVLAKRALDADLDVVEVDENGDVQTVCVRQYCIPLMAKWLMAKWLMVHGPWRRLGRVSAQAGLHHYPSVILH